VREADELIFFLWQALDKLMNQEAFAHSMRAMEQPTRTNSYHLLQALKNLLSWRVLPMNWQNNTDPPRVAGRPVPML